jgi:hypothetical protein
VLKPVELLTDATSKTSQRLIEVYEFVAFSVVNAR